MFNLLSTATILRHAKLSVYNIIGKAEHAIALFLLAFE